MTTMRLIITLLLFCSTLTSAKSLEDAISSLENSISGRIGISVLNTQSRKMWSYKGGERFPLMSTFKVLACAKLLQDASSEQSTNLLEKAYLVERDNLVVWSPVTEKLTGSTITLKKACEATMLTSDNTAANIVLEGIGGPAELTRFLRNLGDKKTRLDRIEPDLNEAKIGDERDTTTPDAMVNTLEKILLGPVLTRDSSLILKTWMQENQISGALIRSVLPKDWLIADRTGSGENGSRGITAAIWKQAHPPIILAIYVTETKLSLSERNRIMADIAKLLFEEFDVVS